MFRRIAIVLTVVLLLLLTSCKSANGSLNSSDKVITVAEYMSSLSSKETEQFKKQSGLLLHPLKEAIELFGNDYELSWEGSYVKLKFNKAKCSVEVYAGAEFEQYDSHNELIDINDFNVIEYLNFAQIEKVYFDSKGLVLTDGITVGMSVREISEKLNVAGIAYRDSSSMVTTEYDKNGKAVNVYHATGKISNMEYSIVFAGDILSRVEITNSSGYLTDEKPTSDKGKKIITNAFSFLSKNNLASLNISDLSYKGKIYSSYYGSQFYSWQFSKGDFEGYTINVETDSPNRIFIKTTTSSQPILFWADDKYIEPFLSYLGKWRGYNTNEYINIKSISKEGIVVFDMYTNVDTNTEKMALLENLSVAIDDIPQTLYDYLRNEYNDEALTGDVQFYNGDVQSGYYTYGGEKFYLIDSLIMDLKGTVSYIPRSLTGRIGVSDLSIHIPNENESYEQISSFGYMENFGRDDPSKDNISKNQTSGGASVINKYLNTVYETSGLKYADSEYKYLYDYVFPVNNGTYHVWESISQEETHYLYVDSSNGLLIKECESGPVSRHSKELIFKANTIVSDKSYAKQKFTSLDGKITVDLVERRITNADSFVKNYELGNLYLDSVNGNKRFMFFASVGNRYALNGYILFDVTTWGATLHITDSNIPNFNIGVYYLSSETFVIDPSISVIGVPKDEENNKYLDDKVSELDNGTKHVVREFDGKIIGYIYIDSKGKKTVKDYYNKILGYYYPDRDVTTDFYGKIIARGDISSSLLFK